jgi:hypothetical protein
MTATTRWLAKARITDDPEGDLIEDMRRDAKANGELPLFKNIHAMRAYLHSKGACHEALQAVPRVWRRYEHWLDRNPV